MQIQCPNCKGFKVTSDRQALVGAGIALCIVGGLFSVFLFPLVFVAAGVCMLITAAIQKPKKYTCKNCGNSWPA